MINGYIYIGDNIFDSLLAISSEEQTKGLMYEKDPKIMSFIYLKPRINKFWMKNTPAPLDIVFCYNGKISQIHKGEPFSTKVIGNDEYSDLIIELPFGTIASSNIKLGNEAGLIKPTIAELSNYF